MSKSTTATPRPRPSARPIAIEDAARKRRERELDARIAAIQPLIERNDAFWRAQGIDPISMLCSQKALSIWGGGRMAPINTMPRKFFL